MDADMAINNELRGLNFGWQTHCHFLCLLGFAMKQLWIFCAPYFVLNAWVGFCSGCCLSRHPTSLRERQYQLPSCGAPTRILWTPCLHTGCPPSPAACGVAADHIANASFLAGSCLGGFRERRDALGCAGDWNLHPMRVLRYPDWVGR